MSLTPINTFSWEFSNVKCHSVCSWNKMNNVCFWKFHILKSYTGNCYLITLLSAPEAGSRPPGNAVLPQSSLEIISDVANDCFQPQQSTAAHEPPASGLSHSKRKDNYWEKPRINEGIPLLLFSSFEQRGSLVMQGHKSCNGKAGINHHGKFDVVYKI